MSGELPPGWERASVEEVCDVTLGQSPPGSSYNETGRGFPFLQGKAEFGDTFPTIKKWTTEPKKFAEEGSVLVSVRAPVGPTNIAPCECVIGRGLASLMPKGDISTSYLLWAMRHSEAELVRQAAGSTFEAITGKQLRSHSLPIAPPSQQKRIIAAIEEHFSGLDAVDSALELAQLRSGQLLESALQAGIRQFPSQEASLASFLTQKLCNGRSVPTANGDGRPVLRLTCLQNGLVNTNEIKLGDFSGVDHQKYQIEPDDFLISRGNGSIRLVGIGGLVPANAPPVAFPDTLIRARVDRSRLRPQFLRLIWNSKIVRRQLESQARTTAGIYKVNQTMIGGVSFPAPSPEDQDRLIQELGQVREVVEGLETGILLAQRRSKSLRRSILADAFSGRLVHQDPNDEPASDLLERISRADGVRST